MFEHTGDPRAVLSATVRTLRRDDRFFLSTSNRFRLGAELCVPVRGVGFVPRRLASRRVPCELLGEDLT